MSSNETITMIATVMICGLLAGVMSIPIIAGITMDQASGSEIIVYNDESNAGWVRFANDGNNYNLTFILDDGDIVIGDQSGTADDMILYADSNACIMCIDGGFVIVNGYADEPNVIYADNVAVNKSGNTITITADSEGVVSASSPSWAYYPKIDGNYAYFGSDIENVKVKAGDNYAFAGLFAGVMAYNDMAVVKDYGNIDMLKLNAVITDYVIDSVNWIKVVDELELELTPLDPHIIDIQPFDPSIIDIQPFDPSIIDIDLLNPNVVLQSVTPTYIDEVTGIWGFDILNPNLHTANIVSYSGSAGNIVIPSTVSYGGETYTVTELGRGSSVDDAIFTNDDIIGSTIKFPSTVITINSSAFRNCSGFTGNLILPENVHHIKDRAFVNCSGFTGNLILPDDLFQCDLYAFYGCTGLSDTIVIQSGGTGSTYFVQQVFTNCTGLKNLILMEPTWGSSTGLSGTSIESVLNLSDDDTFTTTSYGLTADELREDVPALGYIAPLTESGAGMKDGAVYDILSLIPLIMILGVVFMGVYAFTNRYA